MSKLSDATAALNEALKNGDAAGAAAARDKALTAYDQATQADKNETFNLH